MDVAEDHAAEVGPCPLTHPWGEPKAIAADASLGRNGQTERVCVHCRLVRITVHSPDRRHWREWRHPNSAVQFPAQATPPCQRFTEATALEQPHAYPVATHKG